MSNQKKDEQETKSNHPDISLSDIPQELSDTEMKQTKGGATVNRSGRQYQTADYTKSRAAAGRFA